MLESDIILTKSLVIVDEDNGSVAEMFNRMAQVVDLQTPPADVYHTAGGYSHQMAPPSSRP
jgi:hypothetical protein